MQNTIFQKYLIPRKNISNVKKDKISNLRQEYLTNKIQEFMQKNLFIQISRAKNTKFPNGIQRGGSLLYIVFERLKP